MNRQRSVKRILSFSSGVRNTLDTAAAALLWAMMTPGGPALLLDASAGGENRLARFRAHLETAHRHRTRDRAVCEHLYRAAPLHESRRAQRVARHLAVDRRKLIETDDIRLLAERIRETALRQPAPERHLAAPDLRLPPTPPPTSPPAPHPLLSLPRP